MLKKMFTSPDRSVVSALLPTTDFTQAADQPMLPQTERNTKAWCSSLCGGLLAIALLCIPSAAHAQACPLSATYTVADIQQGQAPSECPQPATVKTGKLKLDEAKSVTLGAPGSYHEILDSTSEYAVKLVISATSPIKDIRILELSGPDINSAEEVFFKAKELYKIEELTQGKPLLISVEFPGTIPPRGIAYTDTDGSQQVYAIIESGYDSSHQLSEIKIRP